MQNRWYATLHYNMYTPIFTNAAEVPASIDITGLESVETAGYRVIKYAPDYSLGTASYSVPSNYFMVLRYADVLLMVAEAKMRAARADNGNYYIFPIDAADLAANPNLHANLQGSTY